MITPAGYFRTLSGMLGQTATTNLQRDPDEPYDPADDGPFNIVEVPDDAE